jgi:hypothetical protein
MVIMTDWFALVFRARETSDSKLCPEAGCTEVYLVFPHCIQTNAGIIN